MKKINKWLLACAAALTTLASCSVDNDPFVTAGEDDYPRILNTDIQETSGGEPYALPTITRDVNFEYEAIVTPTAFTTVTWYIDGELVAEGTQISVPLLAGDHIVKIVATTTKGLETSRTCSVKVLALENDPAFAQDQVTLHMMPGKNKTVEGTSLEKVTSVNIGGQEATDVKFENGKLSFTVPQLPEGDYSLILGTSDGQKYGCGSVILSNTPFVLGAVERVLWSGSFNVTWSTPFNELAEQSKEWVADGTLAPGNTLKVYVTGNGQGCAATSWWRNILTGVSDDDVPGGRGDSAISGETELEYELNELSMELITTQDGLFCVGDGYTITKISVVKSVPVGQTLWEGEFDVTWGTPFNLIADQSKEWVADGTLAPGKLLKIYVTGNGQGCAATAWWRNILTGVSDDDVPGGRGDETISGELILDYELNELSMELITTQDGLFCVGDGYKVTKVVVE